MEVCPEDGSWQRWLDGDVDRDERATLTAHLNTCDPCCTFVAALDPETRAGGAGLRVDRYELGQLLGAGAMGLVYAAYDPRLERRVAVKLLRTPGSPDERAALSRRMWREACAMAQLSHPNVVTVFDVGVVEDRVFIAMELVSGQSLSAWCRAAPRTLEQRVAVMLAAGEGLAAIHGAGLVHRDFKPDNVLIDGAGRARVSDFGIAAAVGDSVERAASTPTPTLLDRLTMTRSLLGTPAYMAPEQLDGFVADARSDQFGFCVALYESAFDARPFAGTTVLDRRAAIEAGAIRTPLQRDRASRRVFDVVRRGIAVDPDARYPSMRALLDELGPRRRSSRAPWLAAVAVVATLAAGTTYVLGRETGSAALAAAAVGHGSRPAIAVLGLRGAGPADDSAWLGPAVAELLIASLAGDELRLTRGEDVARARADGVVPAAGELPAPGPALDRARATFGVDLFVVGSYLQSGASVRLNLGLRDARSGALRWQAVEDGPVSELTAIVARAAARIRRQLQIVDDPERVGTRRSTLPAAPAALRAYTEGLEALRRSDQATAARRLTEAAALDPDSAAIQLALAEAYDLSGQYQRRQETLARAFELSRHADREQQLAVEARYRAAMGETARAVELYHSLTTFFPDDRGYGYQLIQAELTLGASRDGLAIIGRMREQPGRADDPWLDVLEGDVRRELGDLDGAEQVQLAAVAHADREMAREPQGRALLALGWIHLQRGQFTRARARADQAIAVARAIGDRSMLFHGLELTGRAEMFLGQLAAAEGHLDDMVREMEALTFRTGFGYNLRAWIQLERGELTAAAAGLTTAFTMNADSGSDVGVAGTLLPAIEAALITGRLDEAGRLVDWLQRIDEHSSSPLQAARYRWMRALVLAAHGQRTAAAALLTEAAAMIDFAPGYATELRLDLARVYLADRDWARATATAAAVAKAFTTMAARELAARAEAVLARARAGAHDGAEADAALTRAERLAEASESPLTRIAVGLARGEVLEQRGGADRRRGRAVVLATRAEARALGLAGLVEPAGPPPR